MSFQDLRKTINLKTFFKVISTLALPVFCQLLLTSAYVYASSSINELPEALSGVKTIDTGKEDNFARIFISKIAENSDVLNRLPLKVALISNLIFDLEAKARSEYVPKKSALIIANDCHGKQTGLANDDAIVVGTHEFGHGVFEANLQSSLKSIFDETAKNSDLNWNLILGGTVESSDNVILAMSDASRPFHELFADTLTVLIFNNPKSLSTFFSECKNLKNERDFSHPYELTGWDSGRIGGFFGANHRVFNPARFHIWNSYETKLDARIESRGLVLGAVWKAIEAMLVEIHQKKITYGEWTKISQEQLNRNFIEKFNYFLDNAVAGK